jgi:hypothetical protein
MKTLALILALALATTPAFARAHGIHTGRSAGFHGYRHVYGGGGYGYGYNGYNGYNGYYGGDPGAAIGLGILGGVLGGVR